MGQTNVLVALKNLIENNNNELLEEYSKYSDNRANSMGDALEYYVKDAFCNAFNMKFTDKDKQYSQYLSYLGNSNNPPDFIIKNSAAIEVKKVKWGNSFPNIALNSSYPKDLLYSDSTLLNKACKNCEDTEWKVKDMYYVIGSISENKVKLLWIVDGECYCADKEIYKRIKALLSNGVREIQGVEFCNTKELGKVKRIDPLGITDLRVRGMWNIEHPQKVFDYLVEDYDKDKSEFQINCLILKSKYDKLNDCDKRALDEFKDIMSIEDVNIKNPNNPAQFIKAVFIKICFNL